MEVVILILTAVTLLELFYLTTGKRKYISETREVLQGIKKDLSDQLHHRLMDYMNQQAINQKNLEVTLGDRVSELKNDLYIHLTQIRGEITDNLTRNRDVMDERMMKIQESNKKCLEEIRQTVEEKIEKTLQSRLQSSFDTVSKQLESVNRGLGEMQTIARDVGTLNKVLSNTKTRGILGELQLGQIIEDIMTPSQYEREFSTVADSNNRVEYAIKLPGVTRNDYVYLPIDSKFPLDSYYNLENAYEFGNKEDIEFCRKNLLSSIRKFAKDINNKYLEPPATTNFGIMFLPTEGLYSEIVRQPTFFDNLRRDENVLVAGPSTLSALLNSLSVGFKTLNIQKSADDISKILGNVKFEFKKFGSVLQTAQKQLVQANSNIDKLLTTRTNAIERVLRDIELSDIVSDTTLDSKD